MEVHVLPAAHEGLLRYRITVPERPGYYAILEVPADAEDPVSLVELFAGSHDQLLEWASDDHEAAGKMQALIEPPSDYGSDDPPHQKRPVATG
jgi:hypothetical protein